MEQIEQESRKREKCWLRRKKYKQVEKKKRGGNG